MPVKIKVSYGEEFVEGVLTDGRYMGELCPAQVVEVTHVEKEIIDRLKNPIGAKPLAELAGQAGKVVIVTGDHTRVLPSARILPVVVQHLNNAGIELDSITILIGVGNHRQVTNQEKQVILGPELNGKIRCVDSRETGYTLVGITKRGTPVEVSTPVAEADLCIALGNIEFHQMAGFSGGVKAIAAGTASRRALEHNHRLSLLQSDTTGLLEENIIRQDMEEFAGIAGLKFIINTVLNENRQIVHITAGDPIKAHRAGCSAARMIFGIKINEKADIVIASPGGFPKDATMYQAQKSVKNALKAVKNGGIIIMTARCNEGFGDPVFEQWINQASTPDDLENRVHKEFVLGGHKCLFIASAVKNARIFTVSDMKQTDVRKLFFEPFNSLQEAIDAAIAAKGKEAGILVMPWAGLTVPLK